MLQEKDVHSALWEYVVDASIIIWVGAPVVRLDVAMAAYVPRGNSCVEIVIFWTTWLKLYRLWWRNDSDLDWFEEQFYLDLDVMDAYARRVRRGNGEI